MKKILSLIVALALSGSMAFAQTAPASFGYKFAQDYGKWSFISENAIAAGATKTVTVRGQAKAATPGGLTFFPIAAGNLIAFGTETVTVTSAGSACSDSNMLQNACTFVATFTYAHNPGERMGSGTYGLQDAILAAGSRDVTVVVDGNSPITSTIITAATHPNTQTTLIKQLNGGNEIWYVESGANFTSSFNVGGAGALTLNPNITSTEPRIVLTETGAGTDLTKWDVDLDAAILNIRTRDDADAAGVSIMKVVRGTTTNVATVVFNEDSNDTDYRLESNALSNFLVIDGNANLNGQISFGGATPTNPQAFFSILPAVNATGVTANQSYYHAQVAPGAAVTIPTGTAPVVASMFLAEPNITATGTVTDAATLYISGAPTEGTSNEALKIAGGSFTTAGRVNQAKGSDVVSGSCSSGDCTLPADGNYFYITGTTSVDGFATAGWQAGAIIIVHTDGNITFNNAGTVAGGFGALALVGAANVSMTANDNMMLIFDGTAWQQIAPTLVK